MPMFHRLGVQGMVAFVTFSAISGGGEGVSTYDLTGTCHFARKIGTHSSLNSDEF